jgi:oligopeptide transport system substrate-binding protein
VFKFKEGSTNNTGWENPKYVDLLNRSAVCRDQKERQRLMREAEEILMSEMPIIPIFHFAINYLQNEQVKEIALSPIGQIDFRWAHIEAADPSSSTR